MRAINRIVDKIFPEFRSAQKLTVRDMHAQGEAAQPGPKAADVAQRLQDPLTPSPEAPVTLTPDTPESAGLPDAAPQEGVAPPPALEEPVSPLKQDLGAPTAEEVTAPLTEPLERRTRARNINLDYFAGVDNVEGIGKALEANAKLMDHGDEPVKTLEQTRANVKGKSKDMFQDVLTSDPAALSDEQLLAGRDVLLTLVEEQQRLAERIAKNEASQEELLNFDLVSDQAAMVQDYMQGKVRQAARALNSMKVVAQTINTADPARIAQAAGGKSTVQRAQAILDMKAKGGTPGEIIETAGKMSAVKELAAAVVNLRSGSLLTGVKTQMVNAINNNFHAGWRGLVVKPIASGVGYVRTGGEQGADRVYAKEAAAEIVGMLHALKESLNIAISTLKHGTITNKGEYVSMYGGRKIDEIAEGAGQVGTATRNVLDEIPMVGKPLGKLWGQGPQQAADMYHRGVEAVSFGMLTAGDDMNKTLAYRSTLYALAMRDAEKLGLKGEAANTHISKLLSDVSHEFHQRAMAEAEIRTFTNREDIAPFLNNAANALVKAGNMIPLMRWFTPFVRTPTAIIDRSLRSTPFAMKWHADVKAKVEAGGIEGDIAKAEIIAASAVTTMIGAMIGMGMMTGNGPARRDDPTGAIRKGLYATGWQPNSVRVGDKYVSLKRGFDPVMLVPLSIAQSVEAAMYAKDEATAWDYTAGAAMTIGAQFADASFMTGMQDLFTVISEGPSSDFAGKSVASFVPRIAKDIDAVFRYATGKEGMDQVPKTSNPGVALSLHLQAAIPFMEPPGVHRYWDGSVATAAGGDMMFSWNTFTPIKSSWLYNSKGRAADPATAALVEARVPVSEVSRKVVVDSDTGASIDLLELPNGYKLYEELKVIVGKHRRASVEALVGSYAYSEARDKGLAGPGSQYAMSLSEEVRKGKASGVEEFLGKMQSPSFAMAEHGGQETRDLLSGKKAGELLLNNALGIASEEEISEMREQGLRGIPSRGQIAPPQGSGSPVKKEYDPAFDATLYVPNIK